MNALYKFLTGSEEQNEDSSSSNGETYENTQDKDESKEDVVTADKNEPVGF